MKAIGKYEILEKIGVGGFGEVFKAHDPFIKRHVAIKTCTSDGPDIRQRFFKEAEIAGNLHHRNITTIYDFGIQDDLPYLIQEYLSGEDLDRKIRRRDYLPPQEKLFYLIQIARGLGHAHSHGIIHRDIKPANIRILEDGTAKILDFGIAKLAQEETGLTKAGMTIGTAAYLAPEQIRGETVDLRTDIFSFGVLAYELLSFERPFRGEQISAILYKILHEEAKRLSSAETEAPEELLSIISSCLDKQPARRFVDAGQLSRALEAVQHGRTSPTVPGSSLENVENDETVIIENTHQPLSQIELGSYEEPAVARETTTSAIGDSSSSTSGAFRILLPLLVAFLAIAGGWWFGARPNRAKAAAAQAAPLEPIEVPPAQLAAPPNSTPSAPGPSIAPGEPAAKPAAQVTSGGVKITPLSWTRKVRVSIAEQTFTLDRAHRLELEPGTYTAVFTLDENGYKASSKQHLEVESGSESTLSPKIPKPAIVTVRPLPGRPQAEIFIDDRHVGRTPLRRLIRKPGLHSVSIRLDAESDFTSSVIDEIDFASDRETVISFDVEASQIEVRHKPRTEGR